MRSFRVPPGPIGSPWSPMAPGSSSISLNPKGSPWSSLSIQEGLHGLPWPWGAPAFPLTQKGLHGLVSQSKRVSMASLGPGVTRALLPGAPAPHAPCPLPGGATARPAHAGWGGGKLARLPGQMMASSKVTLLARTSSWACCRRRVWKLLAWGRVREQSRARVGPAAGTTWVARCG